MYAGKLIFSQVMEHLPLHVFHKCVERYNGNFKVKDFTCLDQYLCMAFAQLTYRRIKNFYGTSENAVKAQIWIAISVYVLVAIMKKRLKIEASLYTILQVLSVTMFERIALLQTLTDSDYKDDQDDQDQVDNQLILFT